MPMSEGGAGYPSLTPAPSPPPTLEDTLTWLLAGGHSPHACPQEGSATFNASAGKEPLSVPPS